MEPELAADALHLGVFVQDFRRQQRQLLGPRDRDQAFQQLGADALSLTTVTHEQRELRLGGVRRPAEPADREDFRRLAVGRRLLDDQRQLAVVVVEADAGQPFVRRADVELQRAK
jgi:hypothetical protein